MTPIEQKRKELEEQIKDTKLRGMNINPFDYELEGFNLGVEMARKEFLKKIDNSKVKNFKTIDVQDEFHMKGWNDSLDMLKQSLEKKEVKA